MSIIFHYLRRYRRRFLIGVLFLLATNALSMTIPRLLKWAIEEMQQGIDLYRVGRYALIMAAIATMVAVVRTVSRILLLGMSRRVAYDLRNRIFSHLLRLPAGFFDHTRTGDLMSRAVNDMRNVRSLFGPGLMNLVNTAIVYAVGLVLMARIDLRMTLLALIPYPILLLSIQRLGRLVHRRTNEVQEQLSTISNRVQENLSAVHLVRTFAQEEREIERFEVQNREYLRRNLRLALARGGIVSLMGAVGGLGTAVVLWLGGLGVLDGRITLGDFVAFNGYLALLAWPTVAMGWVINVFQRGFAALGRINEILDQPPERGAEAGPGEPAPVGGDIEFRDVTFRSVGSSEWSVRSAAASRPWRICWHACTDPNRVRSASADAGSTAYRGATCGAGSAWRRRNRSCSRVRCATTSPWG
jgi:ATP-binding cassette subfamily B protein